MREEKSKDSRTQQMALLTTAASLNAMTPTQRCIIAGMEANAAASVGEMEAGRGRPRLQQLNPSHAANASQSHSLDRHNICIR